jgi:hypothetical protein
MQVTLATDPGTPGWPNEDFAAVAPGAAVLLDGCTTVPRTRDTGCRHGVAWYARTLGSALLGAITADPAPPLADALAAAIAAVRASHEATCDLANPATPAATVTAVRVTPGGADLLALSDSVIAADYGPDRDPLVLTDDHRAASVSPGAGGAGPPPPPPPPRPTPRPKPLRPPKRRPRLRLPHRRKTSPPRAARRSPRTCSSGPSAGVPRPAAGAATSPRRAPAPRRPRPRRCRHPPRRGRAVTRSGC